MRLAPLHGRGGTNDPVRSALIDGLCAADRPESILTWKRNPDVIHLLGGLMTGEIACSHEALDSLSRSKTVEHMRAILQQNELLPWRDHYVALFERWLSEKKAAADTPEVWAVTYRFATWHHIRRIRSYSDPNRSSEGAVRSAKQEITEVVKFLNWLHHTHQRSASTALQLDVDEYLAAGPTTRHLIRTFFVWAKASKINQSVVIGHRYARTDPVLHDIDRLNWIRALMTGEPTTLPYRVIGLLLVLYAQPITKIAALRIDDLDLSPDGMRIRLGRKPADVPPPFAEMIYMLLERRPNMRTTGSRTTYLFPGYRPGRHLHPQTVMEELRGLGLNLRGGRNSALRNLVQQAPAPIVAEMLGYSNQVTTRHQQLAAATYARYAHTLADAIKSVN